MFQRVILIVMDGCGVGAAPDAARYGDFGDNEPNTLGHLADAVGGLHLPNLQRLGLGNILPLRGVPPAQKPLAAFGRMQERSVGKDTVTGHWEMMGVITEQPFPTYPQGFPAEVVEPFQRAIGTKILGNYPASGTEIIKQLGEEHLRTGYPIVYTSADSVFQIAAHEEVVPLQRLYEMCQIARQILQPPHHVQRVIARPFVGRDASSFKRTENRRDFPLPPPHNLIDQLAESGRKVYGVGVIGQVFAERGFAHSVRTGNNAEHLRATLEAMHAPSDFVFANFEDFDMLYGHRNDPHGFAKALEQFDEGLAQVLLQMRPDDLLILTADHGNDPTTPSTDHSREYVPLLCYSPILDGGVALGTRSTFADLASTIADVFGLAAGWSGTSFYGAL
ncbi:MAG: phosphopentomutase [bacterium]|nr:phosphopentomutase [bacterium]